MVIKRTPPPLDYTLKKIISRGGDVTQDSKEKWIRLHIRVTSEMISQIHDILDDRPGIPRTLWVLEAIQEKIKRDQDG
jgi:hypothetical protein